MVVYILNGVVFLNKVACALRTDSCNSGNVVGGVALNSLNLDKLKGSYAVILHNLFGSVENIVLIGAEVNACFVGNKL